MHVSEECSAHVVQKNAHASLQTCVRAKKAKFQNMNCFVGC